MSAREARGARRPDRPPGGRLRPEKIVAPVLAAVTVLGAWAAVAHSSGDGWVQTLGALIGGFLLVGLVGPALYMRRARCRVVDNPLDGSAGTGVIIEVEVNRPLRLRPIDPPGPEAVANGRGPVRLGIVADHRGVEGGEKLVHGKRIAVADEIDAARPDDRTQKRKAGDHDLGPDR